MTLRSLILALLALALLLPGHGGIARADDSPDQVVRQIKAAYLFKFANYIEWPAASFETAESPIIIGVAGAENLANELERISQGRLIGKRSIVVKRLSAQEKDAKLHMLFLGSNASSVVRDWYSSIEGQPILTITDATSEFAQGSAIKFVLDNNRLRFDVSLPAAQRNNVKITAPLLTVARQVEQ